MDDHSEAEQGPNPYADLVRGKSSELVDFELATDPYASMLPGISNVRGARALGGSLASRGWPRIVGIALILLLVAFPLIAAVLSFIFGGSTPSPAPPLPPHA
ncbi:MAG TPA: hypothetical protein VFB58_19020 [Chloroflexota bacterium]|nr:hypothetical protein [Chloroflexota bacterium]